MGNCK